MSDFEVGVGLSRNWNPEEAGKEVVETALKDMKNPPKFFLLFSTIHFDKEKSGMRRFVRAAYDSLPKGTPMIGGTVSGFIIPEGCFTRGATGMAVFSEELITSMGMGNNTKRSPKKAVKEVVNAIQSGSDEPNVLIQLLSGVTIPHIPFLGKQTILRKSIIGQIISKLFPLSSFINTGPDKGDEIIEYISDEFPNSKIIGVALSDDGKLLKNYQFYNNSVVEKALIDISLRGNFETRLYPLQSLKPTDQKIQITKLSRDKRVIRDINGERAASAYLKLLKTDFEYLGNRDRVFRTTFYYPMAYERDGLFHPCVVGPILNDELVIGNRVEKTDLEFYSLFVTGLFNNLRTSLSDIDSNQLYFSFGVICETIIETLGSNIYKLHELLCSLLGGKPFLIPVSAGESIYVNKTAHHLYESFDLLIFSRSKEN